MTEHMSGSQQNSHFYELASCFASCVAFNATFPSPSSFTIPGSLNVFESPFTEFSVAHIQCASRHVLQVASLTTRYAVLQILPVLLVVTLGINAPPHRIVRQSALSLDSCDFHFLWFWNHPLYHPVSAIFLTL